MTPTVRWAVAQRRKKRVISQTVRERAMHDPRRQVVLAERAAAAAGGK